jgi:hypothetical protein
MSDGRKVIIKSLVNGGDLKRFRLDATQLSAGALLEQVCEQHASLERGKFTTKLEVKDRPALQPLGTQALRDALAAAGGETANSVVLRLFSFSVSAASSHVDAVPPPLWLRVAGRPVILWSCVQDRPTHEASVAGEDWQQVVWSKHVAPNAVVQSPTEYRAPFGARLCDLLCFGQQVNQLIARDTTRVRPGHAGTPRSEFANRRSWDAGVQ